MTVATAHAVGKLEIFPAHALADVLARINDHNIHKLDQLLPWNWKAALAKLAG
jgi:transposase